MKNKIYLIALILTLGAVCSPAARPPRPTPTPSATPTPNPYQTRNQHLGVSGGNVNDITNSFCCSGTLGSLVTAGGTQYILSNNHVLARQDQAVAGEDISQPGLIDNGCRPATIVADYTKAVPLGNNVDCALAGLVPGQMDSTGYIEGIGTISSVVKAPSVGLGVAEERAYDGNANGNDRLDQHKRKRSVPNPLRFRPKIHRQLHEPGGDQQQRFQRRR